MRICHLTSVHPYDDIRIFVKEARSLVEAGYEVHLVAPNAPDCVLDGMHLHSVPKIQRSRLKRMTKTVSDVYHIAKSVGAELYHLHDPELIPVGLLLKHLGKKVIFDSHEDVPKQILSKPYLNPLLLRIVSIVFKRFESLACSRFDGIIGATPSIMNKFLTINSNSRNINNFPFSEEFGGAVPWSEKQKEVCYVGGIAAIRGIHQVIKAMEKINSNTRLNLVGCFSEMSEEEEAKTFCGWNKVNEMGFVDRMGVRAVLQRSFAGLVTFLPLPNHLDAQPNKMFEYMSAGIPVIASNFSLWREIIEKYSCGICVDPLNPSEIADAIDFLAENPCVAKEMGVNGRNAILNTFNWHVEEQKLLRFYSEILTKEALI